MPPRTDVAIAAALAVLGILEPTVLGSTEAPVELAVPLTTLAAASLAFRSVAPGPAAGAAFTLIAIQQWASGEPASGMAVFLITLLGIGTLTARAPAREAAPWVLATFALLSLTVAGDPGSDEGDFAYAWTTFFLAAAVGRALHARQRRAEDAEQQAEEAVAGERARLARELHDVVAHGLSVIHVQSRVAEQLMPTDPEAARRALGAVEEAAHVALVDMRRMLDLLRGPDDRGLAPQPGVQDIPALAERTRSAGLRVDYVVEGDPVPLTPGLDLTVYRLVQEALTNVLKHAGRAPTRVALGFSSDAVTVEVVNEAGLATGNGRPTAVGSHGLLGLRERVALFAGELEAGPCPDGGFAMRARLPLEGS